MQRRLYLVVHNVRSTYNVGSLLRSADAFGVEKVYLTGYTPYPRRPGDARLPHLADKLTRQIHKSALGAETSVNWTHEGDISSALAELRTSGALIVALEQTDDAQDLSKFRPHKDVALIVGREVEGIEPEVLTAADTRIEIPMLGQKESLNVASAAAVALYRLRFQA